MDPGGGCLGLNYKKTVNLDLAGLGIPGGAALLFVSLKPYYSSARVGVKASGATFPSQGKEIISTGTFGEITRKVRVFRGWPAPPAVFDYPLFSGGNLAK